jgi:hypothetical protein
MKQRKIVLRENDCRPIAIFYIRNGTTSCDFKEGLIFLRRSEGLYSYFENSLKSTRICALVALIFFSRQEIYTFHQNLRVVYFCEQIAFYYEMSFLHRVPQYFIPQKEKHFISYFIFLFGGTKYKFMICT